MGNAHVLAAVPRAEIDRPVMGALAPLTASLAILGLSLGGAALVQLRVGLRPLTTLRGTVEAIRHGRAASVPEDLPQELAPLARELNALAAETAAALAGARASAARASDNARAGIDGQDKGMVRLYADSHGTLLGGTIVLTGGEHLAQSVALAIDAGMTAERFADQAWYHPVLKELLQSAARDLVDQVNESADRKA
jgi:hypothetical protein